MFRAAGEPDFKNRYASTVMITTGPPEASKTCSGVLLAPSLALTAAHCVCEPRAECVATAYVTTVTYDPVKARIGTGGQTRVYEGVVLPHPELELLVDPTGQVVAGKANLALLQLDEPVEGLHSGFALTDTPAQSGELLVMAGYGRGGDVGSFYGLRYFRKNKVARASTPGGERVLYEQQGTSLYNGFDGGPCFREEGPQRWLVGIATWGSDKELSFTDLSPYQDWLRAELSKDARDSGRP
ncbi:trypsin-like serine protease [Hyalangium gracile]|uniref:trypsin-like serine protease n=1 Tax=Hyalangium gracile TaxID=394092 RepID=UPI001CCD9056|nr:serine protease [Hyalangium gracile]